MRKKSLTSRPSKACAHATARHDTSAPSGTWVSPAGTLGIILGIRAVTPCRNDLRGWARRTAACLQSSSPGAPVSPRCQCATSQLRPQTSLHEQRKQHTSSSRRLHTKAKQESTAQQRLRAAARFFAALTLTCQTSSAASPYRGPEIGIGGAAAFASIFCPWGPLADLTARSAASSFSTSAGFRGSHH